MTEHLTVLETRRWRNRLRLAASITALGCCLMLGGVPSKVSAETMNQALAQAYKTSSKLDAARATLRGVDEGVAIANSGYRPTVAATATDGTSDTTVRTTAGQTAMIEAHPRSYGVTATQPIFKGGQIVNTVRVAEANVRAGRETLRNVEQQVLLDSSTSYLDVIRDLAIVKLRETNVGFLRETLKQTRQRFEVGEVTKTDVAQAEASLAAAVSALDAARAQLQISRANYERNIGTPPGSLVQPRGLEKILPRNIDDAVAISARENPTVVAALYNEQAARHTVDQIYGQLLPTVQVQAAYSRSYDPGGASGATTAEIDSKSVIGSVSVPIYTGGAIEAQVRQAKQNHISRIQQIEQARTETKATVVTAWQSLISARAQLVSDRAQVASAQVALTGVRAEERVGQRTLLDVLNAEQLLLNAQVTVVTDVHNIDVASFTVLSSVGRLNIQELGAVDTVYDAEQHYHEVRRQWWGISITHADGRVETHDFWDTHGRKYDQTDRESWQPLK